MARLRVEEVDKALVAEGFNQEQREKVKNAIAASVPAESYNWAVIFLGTATIALALGSILLAFVGKTVPEPLWGALGAGIGGLAGVFMGRQ